MKRERATTTREPAIRRHLAAARWRRSYPGALAALGLLVASPATAATRYVFATFLGDAEAEEKLHIFTSSDGLDFTRFADTKYGGPTNVLRDPTIMKHTDGKYYIAYTVQSWTTNSSTFGIASSEDLSHWTFLTEVPAGVADVKFTWAPEWFKDDDGVHLIVNIGDQGSQFRSYDYKATNDTLLEWEPPVPIGIGPNYIDTFVVRDGETYRAYTKNETTKFIEYATAPSLHGPWEWRGTQDWAGWGSGKEGIALFQLDDGTWRMFLDCYSGCGFLYADSPDLVTWSGTKEAPSGLSGLRHGTVLREELGVDTDVGVVSSADVASSVGQASSLAADDPSELELESGRSSERPGAVTSGVESDSPTSTLGTGTASQSNGSGPATSSGASINTVASGVTLMPVPTNGTGTTATIEPSGSGDRASGEPASSCGCATPGVAVSRRNESIWGLFVSMMAVARRAIRRRDGKGRPARLRQSSLDGVRTTPPGRGSGS